MRGRSGPVSASKFQLKTLKVSNDTINEIRAPIIWNRPAPALYDYHYDLAGLYYQPMINYCKEREQGGERKIVDLPERLQSNYNKRAYTRRDDAMDYDEFLTNIYSRRMKDKHAKSIHCANEKWSRSKKTTDLNTIRSSANDRDRYLCQIQFIYTGKLSREQQEAAERGRRGSLQEEGEPGEERGRRSVSAEPSTFAKPVDNRYGPDFEKKTEYYSKYLNRGGSAFALMGLPEPLDPIKPDIAAIEGKQIASAMAQYEEYRKEREEGRGFVEAETIRDFLKLDSKRKAEREAANYKEYKPLYNDTSYVKAHKDVQRSVKDSGKSENPLRTKEDINLNYRSRGLNQIGRYEKAVIHSELYREAVCPEFDIGYDTIDRRCVVARK